MSCHAMNEHCTELLRITVDMGDGLYMTFFPILKDVILSGMLRIMELFLGPPMPLTSAHASHGSGDRAGPRELSVEVPLVHASAAQGPVLMVAPC